MKAPGRIGLAGVLVAMAAGEAIAAVKYFRPAGTTAKWSDNVWYDSEVGGSLVSPPGASDRAVILANKRCQVVERDEAADTIVVRPAGTLEIHPEWTLTLDNNDGNVNGAINSIIDGEFHIQIDDPEDPVEAGTLAITAMSHTFAGDGRVLGDHQNCLVTIAAGKTLTNQLDNDAVFAAGGFVGAMTVRGLAASGISNGEFRNEGIVFAMGTVVLDDEEFVLEVDTRLSDHATVDQAIWMSASGGTLVFQGGTRSLNGHIIVDCKSELVFDEGSYVATCGTFSWLGGGWLVDTGATFRYTEFVSSEPNPGTDLCPTERCDCMKWEITGTDSGDILCQ